MKSGRHSNHKHRSTEGKPDVIRDIEDQGKIHEGVSLSKAQDSPLVGPIGKRHELAGWMRTRSVRMISAMSFVVAFGFLLLRKSNRRERW
mmetsp:Transcript_128367/g.209099  ORF Transcript_128367/g.209099 Transcript_128367/m.209099 type:complete len:90 (+) Transcript_128367:48-317(+)